MSIQYISDNKGKTTGVFIPIEDWETLKKDFKGLEEKEADFIKIPEWHKEIVRKRLIDYKKNPDNVLDWDDVKHKFKQE